MYSCFLPFIIWFVVLERETEKDFMVIPTQFDPMKTYNRTPILMIFVEFQGSLISCEDGSTSYAL